MKLNKAFIFATGGAYIGLALLTILGYPTVVGAPTYIFVGWVIAAAIFLVWGSQEDTRGGKYLGVLYGAICMVTFMGFENWGNQGINLAMALWDMICAVCFLVE